MIRYLQYLWNGGLSPDHAEPGELRARRVLSTTCLLFIPIIAMVLLLQRFAVGDAVHTTPVFASGCLLVLSLELQARFGLHRLAVQCLLFGLFAAPTIIIFQVGLNNSNWVWLLLVSVFANLLSTRTVGFVWSVIVVFALAALSSLAGMGYIPVTVDVANHASSVAIGGSCLTVLMAFAGYTFRRHQEIAESSLLEKVEELERENKVRRMAEDRAMAGERAKAVFLENISHELRTPLNGVIGASDLLDSTHLDDKQGELVTIIKSSGEILLDLINNVLDLTNLEENRVVLRKVSFSPSELLFSVGAAFKVLGRKKGVSFSFKVDASVPDYLIGSTPEIRQILLNLCSNALKFTEAGAVSANLAYEDGKLRIYVADTGVGIPDELQGQLFSVFSHSGDLSLQHGSGLGLAIAKKLVELMDGSISFESEQGMGTIFEVSLPLPQGVAPEDERVAQDNEVTPEGEGAQQYRRVLVVDDNKVNRIVAEKLLKKLSYEVALAEDGSQAVDAVRSGDIDLVLMDIQMPVMDGLEATSEIRSLPAPLSEVPIIAVTAHAMPEDREKFLSAGMNEYLAKPVRSDSLQAAIDSLR